MRIGVTGVVSEGPRMLGRLLLVGTVTAAAVAAAPAVAASLAQGHLIYTDAYTVNSVRADGGHHTSAGGVPGYPGEVQLSPDGRWVAFSVQPSALDPTGGLEQVWIARADLSHAHVVASVPGLFSYQPTWSPDSRRLALVTAPPVGYFGLGYQSHLWVMNRDGTGRRPVVALVGAIEQPTWSPRNGQVAFVADAQQTSAAIMVVDVDTTPAVPSRVSPLGQIGFSKPHWSPTGDRLDFMDAANLYVVKADGSGLRIVGEGNNYPWNGGAVWSPNGRYLAYCLSSSGYFFGGPSGSGPYVLDVSGRTRTRLLDDTPCFAPAWSPDGRSLAYVVPGDASGVLVVHSVSGARRTELTSADGNSLIWTRL